LNSTPGVSTSAKAMDVFTSPASGSVAHVLHKCYRGVTQMF
jgi:hypothetical protein